MRCRLCVIDFVRSQCAECNCVRLWNGVHSHGLSACLRHLFSVYSHGVRHVFSAYRHRVRFQG